jgi:V-type H+-transporting ATPase subunit A
MEIAKVIREDFLKQNAFSTYDYYCPLEKTIGMMKCIVAFYDRSMKSIMESGSDAKVTWALIVTKLKKEFDELS